MVLLRSCPRTTTVISAEIFVDFVHGKQTQLLDREGEDVIAFEVFSCWLSNVYAIVSEKHQWSAGILVLRRRPCVTLRTHGGQTDPQNGIWNSGYLLS